ncbi:MAG: FG-GAP repeat domain-containing protein [Mariniblastus sp.]
MLPRLACFFLILATVSLAGCGKKPQPVSPEKGGLGGAARVAPQTGDTRGQIKYMIETENLVTSFSPLMKELVRSFRDQDVSLQEFALPQIEYRGIAKFDLAEALKSGTTDQHASHLDWPLDPAGQFQSISPGQIWAPLLGEHRFESCQIGTVGTRFVDSGFQMETKFEGRFKTEGQTVGVKAHQTIQWEESPPGSWKIAKWHQTDFQLVYANKTLFADVTKDAIPNLETREKIQRSKHHELISKTANAKVLKLTPLRKGLEDFNDWESAYQYPGVSVVDLDQDGLDDLFVTARWLPAQMLRNRGDGTFEDVTESCGLGKVTELATCSLFADFDNDGDSDVFICRTLDSSMYFENVDGVFKFDEEQNKEYAEMKLVSSASIADINRDGLLDVYLTTYGFGTGWVDSKDGQWANSLIREKDRLKMRLRVEKSHWYVDRGGAPNVLLMNDGGKLKRVKIDDTIAQWRNSYQSVWSDVDNDGDPDLYICNDFSPDFFLRNDTARGSMEPKFTEVTEELVPGGTMGFGMGANWGDYNNDGRLDLYVSNMYSKAGNRIVRQMEDVDERVKVASRGNFLYENQGGTFKQVAGLETDAQQVSKVGWSFGGQFADFDNDGNLDVYVGSGFYTPPEDVAKPGDL